MAYYDALIAKWATLSAGTTAEKLANINAQTVAGPSGRMVVPTYKLYNAIDPTEFVALTAAQQQRIRDILGMGTVDASPGTHVRAVLVSIFSNASGPTRIAFTALANSIEASAVLWWKSAGYTSPISNADLSAAGGLS